MNPCGTCPPDCEDTMTCQREATTSARAEAASNAMAYAMQATDAETERRTAQAAMIAIAANADPANLPRLRNLEDLRDTSVKQRDIAITMATMWANVAAVQEQP